MEKKIEKWVSSFQVKNSGRDMTKNKKSKLYQHDLCFQWSCGHNK